MAELALLSLDMFMDSSAIIMGGRPLAGFIKLELCVSCAICFSKVEIRLTVFILLVFCLFLILQWVALL